MQVQISAGKALKEKAVYTIGPGSVCKCMGQCTVEGSVQECVHWGCKFFKFVFKIDQSETTKSHSNFQKKYCNKFSKQFRPF